jgi:hypothetical protein
MTDFAFYNVGCHEVKGVRRLSVLVRRMLRRILRPIFVRQAEMFRQLADLLDDHEHRIFALRVGSDALDRRNDELAVRHEGLSRRQDELADQIQTTMAFGWDYVALVRRLAALEDQVAVLTGTATVVDESDQNASILFPGLENTPRRTAGTDDTEVRSKVC